MPQQPGHVLKFKIGNRPSNEIVLREGTCTLGRGLDVDMTLEDETLSRSHAQFVVRGEQCAVEDLGSTNGTYVNGVQVTGAVLKPDDKVVVGACLITYLGHRKPGVDAISAASAPRRRSTRANNKTETDALVGDLASFGFANLAQLLAASSASGCLHLETIRDVKLYLKGGRLVAAVMDGDDTVDPEKVFYRVVRWDKGSFVLLPHEEYSGKNTCSHDVNMLLLEGTRIVDELTQLNPPEGDDNLFVPEPIMPPLRKLSLEQLDTLQLCHNYHHVETVLDKSLGSDIETLKDIVFLIDEGYLVHG